MYFLCVEVSLSFLIIKNQIFDYMHNAFGGAGLCSCRVRGVDGSCAKQLTVESYMVIYAPNSYTY